MHCDVWCESGVTLPLNPNPDPPQDVMGSFVKLQKVTNTSVALSTVKAREQKNNQANLFLKNLAKMQEVFLKRVRIRFRVRPR